MLNDKICLCENKNIGMAIKMEIGVQEICGFTLYFKLKNNA